MPKLQMRAKELSRRALLGGSAVAAIGIGVRDVSATIISDDGTAPNSAGQDPKRVPIVVQVNGIERAMSVEPNMTLAEALRGPLGLTGTKIACNRGACSACTVWLDGLPVCSCMMLVVEVDGRQVRTIEGLADGDRLHPIQTAFIAHDAMQCGFCTPGMAMSCAALLEHTPDPSPEDVERAIGGHICRCGSYPHVVEATLAAARARRG